VGKEKNDQLEMKLKITEVKQIIPINKEKKRQQNRKVVFGMLPACLFTFMYICALC
jgi:hypothetical protein